MLRAKEYVRVESLKQAYELNQKRSSIVVGGMMWVKMWNLYKMTIIDLSDLGMDRVEETEEEFRIGCMCTLRTLELHPSLNRYFDGIFQECTRHIVGTQFRNTATVGGSIFGRHGFSDILTCMMMLDSYVELYEGGLVPIEEFAKRKPDRDIVVQVVIRKDKRKAAYTSQRKSKTDFPIIACGVSRLEDTYFVSVGARPFRACLTQVEKKPEISWEQLAKNAVGAMEFHSNLRAGKEYRRHLAEVYVMRLMEQLGEGEF